VVRHIMFLKFWRRIYPIKKRYYFHKMNSVLLYLVFIIVFAHSSADCQQPSQVNSPVLSPTKILGEPIFEATYNKTAVRDSTQTDLVVSESMVLSVGLEFSEFQSLAVINRRKTLVEAAATRKEQPSTQARTMDMRTQDPNFFRYKIVKNILDKEIITFDRVFADAYKYEESADIFNWRITGKEKSFLGYKILEATTTYGCRNWVAWFTPDIPISDGPYKFQGLPGLIVKVSDTKNHYVFELESISTSNFLVENIEMDVSTNRIKTTLAEFIRVRDQFTNDASSIVGNFTDDPHTRAVATSNAARRNNFIELCAD
jgi:GLPGLI family protein